VSVFARTTEALRPLDAVLNGTSDLSVRFAPWMWWPADPPRADRPYGVAHHVAYLAWSAAAFALVESLMTQLPEEQRPSGARLRYERVATAVAGAAVWWISAGAWDRRAARLRRRPWTRLLH
jgi:hypothetical protein